MNGSLGIGRQTAIMPDDLVVGDQRGDHQPLLVVVGSVPGIVDACADRAMTSLTTSGVGRPARRRR